jgi:polysaccharide biosynthesis/export protein
MHAYRIVSRIAVTVAWAVGIACAGDVFAAEKGGKAAANVSRELAMRPLPAYRIEPPDVLSIEVLKLVPLPPYRAAIYDVLQIRVLGALTDQPIDGFFLVEGDGRVSLGPSYGKVHVAGKTTEEAETAITKKLEDVLHKPEVSVQLARTSGMQAVTGEYLVAPDGIVNLRRYGIVQVMGKTIEEAAAAVEKQLTKYFVSPDVSVEVKQYNSKVFFVITEGAGMGDNIRRVPITGSDTVLDALSAVNGLSQVSSKRIWISRPSRTNPAKGKILTVDYAGITKRGATATNYQIRPGDRLFIAEDKSIALNNWVTKKTATLERVLGLISLGASTADNVEKLLLESQDKPSAGKEPEE